MYLILQTAIVFANENGLKVIVEDAKCVQANAFLETYLFLEFKIKDHVTFKINLTVLLVSHCKFLLYARSNMVFAFFVLLTIVCGSLTLLSSFI